MDTTRQNLSKLEDPKVAPSVLAIGSVLWRLFAAWGHVDFILSMREEKVATVLQSLLDYGWVILLVVGVGWFFVSKKINAGTVHWGTVASVGIIAFLFGILTAAYSTATIPNVIGGWSGATDGCSALVDTSKLVGFKNRYHLFLVCQIADPTIDPLEDTRIAISSPFNITGRGLQIVVPYAPDSPIKKVATVGTLTNLTIVLLPREQDLSRIKRLSDVPKDGGIVLIPGQKFR